MGKRKAQSESDSGSRTSDSDLSDEYRPSLPHKRCNTAKKKRRVDPAEITRTSVAHHAKSIHIIKNPGTVRLALLDWYSGVHATRGMPWRKPYDYTLSKTERAQRAYEVWVSEVMLQQTQVSTVIPYYNTWMEKFPTIKALAASPIDQVNAVWKGLGYYSRASRLLAGAQKVVKEYDSLLPDNAKDLEANIPGIGRYSAGAISSIAYGERVPVLDGNVHRLMSRLLALHANPKSKATLDILWQAASDMVKELPNNPSTESNNPIVRAQNPGDINQALIELGSTVCKVRDPSCGSCPLRSSCLAYHYAQQPFVETPDIEDTCTLCEPVEGDLTVTMYPMKIEKKKAREELDIVNVVEWRHLGERPDRRFLLLKRPETGLLAGLLEFPTIENVQKTTTAGELDRMLHTQLSQILPTSALPEHSDPPNAGGLRLTSVRAAGNVTHVFSHIKKTYRVQWMLLEGGDKPPEPINPHFQAVKAVKPKRKGKEPAGTSESSVPTALWASLHDVTTANIGTGVVKIWKQVNKLWESPQQSGGDEKMFLC